MSPQALIILAAFGGVVAGFIIAKLLGGSSNEQPLLEAEERYNKLQDEFNAYRSQVDKHFVDTADAVDELNRSYKNVMQHLSFGAHGLMGAATLQEQLALRSDKAVTVSYLANVVEEESVAEDEAEKAVVEEAVAAEAVAEEIVETAEEKVEETVETIEEKVEEVVEAAEEIAEAVEETVEEAVEAVEEKVEEISNVAEEVAEQVEEATEEAVETEKK